MTLSETSRNKDVLAMLVLQRKLSYQLTLKHQMSHWYLRFRSIVVSRPVDCEPQHVTDGGLWTLETVLLLDSTISGFLKITPYYKTLTTSEETRFNTSTILRLTSRE